MLVSYTGCVTLGKSFHFFLGLFYNEMGMIAKLSTFIGCYKNNL